MSLSRHDSMLAAAPHRSAAAVSRRRVLGAAGWAAPAIVVASAVPAFACSPTALKTYNLVWGTSPYTYGTKYTSGSVQVSPTSGTGNINVGVSTQTFGNAQRVTDSSPDGAVGYPGNLMVTTSNIAGLGSRGLAMHQRITGGDRSPNTYARLRQDRQTVTFNFGVPVEQVAFTITDIDSANGDFWDVVETSPSGSFSFPAGSTLVGRGVAEDYTSNAVGGFRQPSVNMAYPNDSSPGGSVTMFFAGPLSSLQVTYWNRENDFSRNTDTDQVIFMSGMSWKSCG